MRVIMRLLCVRPYNKIEDYGEIVAPPRAKFPPDSTVFRCVASKMPSKNVLVLTALGVLCAYQKIHQGSCFVAAALFANERTNENRRLGERGDMGAQPYGVNLQM